MDFPSVGQDEGQGGPGETRFRSHRIQTGLIFCFGRDMTFEANKILARKLREWQGQSTKIVGVDLAGPESVNPLSDPEKLREMKEIFDMTPEGLGRTVHVGETPHVDIDTFVKTGHR